MSELSVWRVQQEDGYVLNEMFLCDERAVDTLRRGGLTVTRLALVESQEIANLRAEVAALRTERDTADGMVALLLERIEAERDPDDGGWRGGRPASRLLEALRLARARAQAARTEGKE